MVYGLFKNQWSFEMFLLLLYINIKIESEIFRMHRIKCLVTKKHCVYTHIQHVVNDIQFND